MKNISILLLILSSACHTPAPTATTKTDSVIKTNSNPIQKIVFNSSSRGYQKNLLFTKDSAILVINSSFEDNPSKNIRTRITAAEWDRLITSLNGVDIAKITELTSPTMKRAVDAANHSNIAISTDKEYNHEFDDYNPNEQLKKLMEAIQEIEKDRSR